GERRVAGGVPEAGLRRQRAGAPPRPRPGGRPGAHAADPRGLARAPPRPRGADQRAGRVPPPVRCPSAAGLAWCPRRRFTARMAREGSEVPVELIGARALWDAEPGYLNTASYGLPPRPAWEELQRALADWRV